MKKILLLTSAVVLVAIVSLQAGVERYNNKEGFNLLPSPGTCFRRDNNGDIMPLVSPVIYDDTIMKLAASNMTTVSYSLGYWEQDANGDYCPITLTGADYTDRLSILNDWDIQWEIDADGNIYPKE